LTHFRVVTSGAAAAGAHFVVDSEKDAVDASPGDGACATADGACTLRAAVMETNALPGLDTVAVPTGTYLVSIPAEPLDPPGGGDIDITDDLDVTGMGADVTVVKGPGGEDQWSVFSVAEGVSVTLADLQVREGSGASGGGIESHGLLRLRRTAVVSNTATFGGGVQSFGQLDVTDSRIEDNRSSHGGGVVVENLGRGVTASFERTIISGNEPAGISAPGGGTVLLTDSDVVSNALGVSNYHGVVIAVGGRIEDNQRSGIRSTDGIATVSDSSVSRNGEGVVGSGAMLRVLGSTLTLNEESAIADRNKGKVYVASSDVMSNTGSFGGGIAMSNLGNLQLVDSTVAGNRAAHGGGVYIGNGGQHQIVNSTISGNAASFGNNIRNGGDLTLINTTVWSTVGEGRVPGINNTNILTLKNSVLAAKPPAISCAPSTTGETVSEGNNVSSDDSCQLDPELDDLEGVDPMLGPLADNGGRSATHALLDGSPAIDHGDDADCPDSDQRGVVRPQGASCDAGSYEYGAEAPPGPTPSRDFAITDLQVFGYAWVGPDGLEPVVGATVTVQAMPGRCDVPVTTDAEGAFEVVCPAAHYLGAIMIEIEAEGYERWEESYMLGPFGQERGPIDVDALLTWAGGPTPTPSPTPSATPDPGRQAYVPVAYKRVGVR
jgi:hypothetical protein